jgi:hypothetical protein
LRDHIQSLALGSRDAVAMGGVLTMKNDPALDTSVESLRRTINAQKVELASRNLRILGLEETLKDAARFMEYFAEGRTNFEGSGTPTTCLARIRRILE